MSKARRPPVPPPHLEFFIKQIAERGDSTLSGLYVEDVFFSFVLEDKAQLGPKVTGATRIPAGRYELKPRAHGRFAARSNYKRSIEIVGVPNYTDILMHVGNTILDTRGCPLPGFGASRDGNNHMVTESGLAMRALDDLVFPHFNAGGRAFITITR